jgi:hypothetical protein
MAEYAYTKATFKAFVDAFIPRTPYLAYKEGEVQFFGGVDSKVDDYIIWSLDHYLTISTECRERIIPLADPTAEMFNIAAQYLISSGYNTEPVDFDAIPYVGTFAALSMPNRFQAITLLEELKISLSSLPYPFRDNPGFVLSVISTLNRLVIIGYYSEWSGYGTSALESPEERQLSYFPLSWQQVQYPGPSKGYHAMRGYLVKKFVE